MLSSAELKFIDAINEVIELSATKLRHMGHVVSLSAGIGFAALPTACANKTYSTMSQAAARQDVYVQVVSSSTEVGAIEIVLRAQRFNGLAMCQGDGACTPDNPSYRLARQLDSQADFKVFGFDQPFKPDSSGVFVIVDSESNAVVRRVRLKSSSLASRIKTHTIKLPAELSIGSESAYLHRGSYSRDWYDFSKVFSVITKTNEQGRTAVGWQDRNGNAHVSVLSQDLMSVERGIKFPAKRLRDVHFDGQGIATLALEGSRMVLRKYGAGDQLEWSKTFAVKEYSSAMHNGRIVKRRDGGYAAYFGVHGGGHESDALQQVTSSGASDNNGKLNWSWGCSHSIDQRLLSTDDGRLIPVCIGDYYPAGFTLRATGKNQVITPDIQHRNGIGSPNLGGLVEYKDHFVSIISSAYGRNNRDVALVAFEKNAPYRSKKRVWLTTTSTNEVKPKITLDRDGLVVMYQTQGDDSQTYTSKKLNLNFSADFFSVNELSSEKIKLEIGPMEDLVSFQSSKAVIAARSPGDPGSLLIQVIENGGSGQ